MKYLFRNGAIIVEEYGALLWDVDENSKLIEDSFVGEGYSIIHCIDCGKDLTKYFMLDWENEKLLFNSGAWLKI